MRHPRPLSCPTCGEPPEACLGCGRDFVDQDGRRISPPLVRRWRWARAWPLHAVSGLTLVWFFAPAIGALAGPEMMAFLPVGAMVLVLLGNLQGPAAFWARRLATPWRLRRRRARAGEPQPIAACRDGVCRIRGRVYVLQSASWSADDVGAYCLRMRTDAFLSQHQRCGRFAVIDDTGIAIVDDDSCEVVPLDGRIRTREEIAAREGDTVEVIGRARRAPAPDVRELAQGSDYRRGAPVALLFDGAPEAPVTVVAPRYVA